MQGSAPGGSGHDCGVRLGAVMNAGVRLQNGRESSVPVVVAQHVEEVALLRSTRRVIVRAPHIGCDALGRLDNRLAAHVDGVLTAGPMGLHAAYASLDGTRPTIFLALVCALELHDTKRIAQLLAIAEVSAEAVAMASSAFGWVRLEVAYRIATGLLQSPQTSAQCIGLAALDLHRADPGMALPLLIEHPSAAVRARALQAAANLGRVDLLDRCIAQLRDVDPMCRMAAASSALMLGHRDGAVQVAGAMARQAGPHQRAALSLALLTSELGAQRSLLEAAAASGEPSRLLLQASGPAGDVRIVPALLDAMARADHARVAGEAFGWLTGADLVELGFDRDPPGDFPSEVNDDPYDENVAMDEDEDLPWPDPVKVADWWHKNKHNFQPGVRYFMGKPVTVEHCIHVLKTGRQRQRFIAARYLKLLQPERPLFNCAAPAWRQQALLAKM